MRPLLLFGWGQIKRGDDMARREEYESRTEKFLLPLLEKHQFELVDVEYVKEAGTGICGPI